MNVLFLTAGPFIDPASRYRVLQYRERLQNEFPGARFYAVGDESYYQLRARAGNKYRFITVWRYLSNRLRMYGYLCRHMADIQVVFSQRVVLGLWFCALLKWRRKIILFDCDDAIYARYSPVGKWRFHLFLRYCSCILAGNRIIASYCQAMSGTAVEVVPTGVAVAKYPVRQDFNRPDHFVVGWIGSYAPDIIFEVIGDTLARLNERHGNIKLKVIGPADGCQSGTFPETINVPWEYDREVDELQSIHVGIMPLHDTEFMRGKCALKALQYMALGIPAVVSPVGMNTELIQDGGNGFLAADPAEWFAKLDRLISEYPSLGKSVGREGRLTVERRFDSRAIADQITTMILQYGSEPNEGPHCPRS